MDIVLNYLSETNNEECNIKPFSSKLAMLIALTWVLRVSELGMIRND